MYTDDCDAECLYCAGEGFLEDANTGERSSCLECDGAGEVPGWVQAEQERRFGGCYILPEPTTPEQYERRRAKAKLSAHAAQMIASLELDEPETVIYPVAS